MAIKVMPFPGKEAKKEREGNCWEGLGTGWLKLCRMIQKRCLEEEMGLYHEEPENSGQKVRAERGSDGNALNPDHRVSGRSARRQRKRRQKQYKFLYGSCSRHGRHAKKDPRAREHAELLTVSKSGASLRRSTFASGEGRRERLDLFRCVRTRVPHRKADTVLVHDHPHAVKELSEMDIRAGKRLEAALSGVGKSFGGQSVRTDGKRSAGRRRNSRS